MFPATHDIASDTLKTMFEPDLKAHERVLAGTASCSFSFRVGLRIFRQGRTRVREAGKSRMANTTASANGTKR